MIDFKLEQLENGADEAKVTHILKKEGSSIKAGEPLLEVEAEKTTYKIESTVTGTVSSIEVEVGDTVTVGDLLARIEEGQQAVDTDQEKEAATVDSEQESELTIIGGGPGGYVAAIKAAQRGLDVVLVEKERVGGTCLNWGCIPTKALVRSGEVLKTVREAGDYGCRVEGFSFDLKQAMDRKDRVVDRLVGGIEYLLDQHDVRVIEGTGDILDPETVRVTAGDKNIDIKSDNIIIATGSRPSTLPIPGTDLPGVINSRDALSMEELPDKMVVVGGGIIGMEFAFIYNNFGVDVSVVEYLDKCVSTCDLDLCQEIVRVAEASGINIFAGSPVKEIKQTEDNQLIVVYDDDGEDKYLIADKVLMAVGRQPDYGGLDVEGLGLELDENDRGIKVDDHLETSIPGIYAIGDVTDRVQLAHVASHQGIIAVKNILGEECEMDYSAVPSAIFTDPEMATVGLDEESAREQGLDIEIGRFPFSANGKVLTHGETDGFIKLIKNKEDDRVLGAAIIGVHATDLIAELTLAVENDMTAEQLIETIHAHPTTAEVVHEAALATTEDGPLHYLK